MIYLRSLAMGLLFVILAAILFPVGVCVILLPRAEKGETIGFDPVSIAKSYPPIWAIAGLLFALGFFWEFRRMKSRQPK